jgi:hypothetical protein
MSGGKKNPHRAVDCCVERRHFAGINVRRLSAGQVRISAGRWNPASTKAHMDARGFPEFLQRESTRIWGESNADRLRIEADFIDLIP